MSDIIPANRSCPDCPPGLCLAEFQRTTLGLPEGTTGVVMAIHTFGSRENRLEAGDWRL